MYTCSCSTKHMFVLTRVHFTASFALTISLKIEEAPTLYNNSISAGTHAHLRSASSQKLAGIYANWDQRRNHKITKLCVWTLVL